MSKKSSLGRGLDALLSKKSDSSPNIQQLKIAQITQAAYQPRQVFDPEALAELAQSIREKGVLQPLLVRPTGTGYEIVAGERRWRASQLAGLQEVPALVRELSEREALEMAIVENLQREDLGPLEEARAYQALLSQGLKQEEVAQAVGKSRSAVTNSLRLLSLPDAALQALEQGEISAGHARALLAQPPGDQAWALGQIKQRGLTVREAEALKREKKPDEPLKVNPPRAYRQLELDLSRRTGTRVRITGEDRGKVELGYGSREELGRILELLGYSAEG